VTSLDQLLLGATPGPWEAIIDDDTEAYVTPIMVRPDPLDETGGLSDADAALIAVVPELAKVAQAAERIRDQQGCLDPECDDPFCTEELNDVLDVLARRLAEDIP
jgi:hypothetical protein